MIDDATTPELLLRAGVAQGADHLAGLGQPEVAAKLSDAEVGHPELPAQVEEQVGRLDVAVNDAHLMSVLQRLGGLLAEGGDAREEPSPLRGPLRREGDGSARRRVLRLGRRSLGIVAG